MADAGGIKLVVVGDGVVGKTCLLVTYTANEFPKQYIPTIFENITQNKTVNVNGSEMEISLDLWDTAGQDQYDRLRILAYPDTDIILLCFSAVDLDSLSNIESKWYPEIHHHIPSAHILLVGTKSDLKNDTEYLQKHGKTAVPEDKIEAMKQNIGATGYIECSALKGENVDLVFETAITKFLVGDQGGRKQSTSNGGGCCTLL